MHHLIKQSWWSTSCRTLDVIGFCFYFSPFQLELSQPSPDKVIFQRTSDVSNYWSNKDNRREFLDWFGKQKGVSELSDWYKLRTIDVEEMGGPLFGSRKVNRADI
jgi:hypothetical protein